MRAEERQTGKDTTDGGAHRKDSAEKPATSAWSRVFADLAEIREHAAHLLGVKKDAVKHKARKAAVLTALGILGGFAFATLVAGALIILLLGLAHGLGEALGGRIWLGQVITGAGFLLVVLAALALALSRLRRASYRQTVARYERRRTRQRVVLRHDAGDRLPGRE